MQSLRKLNYLIAPNMHFHINKANVRGCTPKDPHWSYMYNTQNWEVALFWTLLYQKSHLINLNPHRGTKQRNSMEFLCILFFSKPFHGGILTLYCMSKNCFKTLPDGGPGNFITSISNNIHVRGPKFKFSFPVDDCGQGSTDQKWTRRMTLKKQWKILFG